MDRNQVLTILKEYGISDFNEKREIDSSLDDDYRLNIIIDKKYVLRINNEVMTEERLASIDRLASRYRAIGVAAPRLVRSIDEQFSVPFENHVCYVSEYLDYPTFREKETELDAERISHEVWKSIGKLSKNYSDVDLSPVNSMWSIIDLAPLDEGIDEKQENLNLLVSELEKIGEEKNSEGSSPIQ
jgi:Ser/Thr protein kinase RdoA (MazF antagonist)